MDFKEDEDQPRLLIKFWTIQSIVILRINLCDILYIKIWINYLFAYWYLVSASYSYFGYIYIYI